MKLPKISVVTISYNQASYLEEAMLSVLNQDYSNIEYIVIDGNSTDGSQEIIKKYQDKLSYWVSEKDNGPAHALNKGFAKATGDYFYYLNSDDILMPGVFSKIIKFIQTNPNYDFYYGHGYMTRGTLDDKFKIYSDRWSLNRYRLEGVAIIQQSTFIKKEAFIKAGGFNEKNKTHWDGELLVDIALSGASFKRYHEHVAIFRVYPESSSGGSGNTEQYHLNIANINKNIKVKKGYVDYPIWLIKLSKIWNDPVVLFKRLFSTK